MSSEDSLISIASRSASAAAAKAKATKAEIMARNSLIAAGVHSIGAAPAVGKIGPGVYSTSRVSTPLGKQIVFTKNAKLTAKVEAKAPAKTVSKAKAASTGRVVPVPHPAAPKPTPPKATKPTVGTSAGTAGKTVAPPKPAGSSLLSALGGTAELVIIGVALFVLALLILKGRKRR